MFAYVDLGKTLPQPPSRRLNLEYVAVLLLGRARSRCLGSKVTCRANSEGYIEANPHRPVSKSPRRQLYSIGALGDFETIRRQV